MFLLFLYQIDIWTTLSFFKYIEILEILDVIIRLTHHHKSKKPRIIVQNLFPVLYRNILLCSERIKVTFKILLVLVAM